MAAKPKFKFLRWPQHSFCVGASLALGVLWLSSCATPPEKNDAANNATNNDTSNAVGNGSTPVGKSTPVKSLTTQGRTYTLFVPNDQALLSKQIVRDTNPVIPTNIEGEAKRVLQLLFTKLEFLPTGTRLLESPQINDGVWRLNLSKPFLQLDTQHETPVALTLDAISRTLGALRSKNGKPGRAAKIRFLSEGKMIRTLSEFSLNEAWQASEPDEAESEVEKIPQNKTSGNKTTGNATTDNKMGGGV